MNRLELLNGQTETLDELYRRSQKEMEILYTVSKAMQSTLELDEILFTILTGVTAHHGLGFNRAILFLANHHERCLNPAMAIGPESVKHAQEIWGFVEKTIDAIEDLTDPKKIQPHGRDSQLFQSVRDLKVPLEVEGNHILARAYHQGQPKLMIEEEIQSEPNDPFLQIFKSRELVIMPLKSKNSVNGIIVADNLYTQKAVSHDEMRMFEMLANQAGLAIENSRLYQKVRHQSHTDSLTGLWNHGFFQSQLTCEVEKSLSSKEPTSLILMDIDNFKQLNDTEGHQKGDAVIKAIANTLMESSRNIDFVCRYGGEEFTIILTETTKDHAYAIGERMRQRIANLDCEKLGVFDRDQVTVSIGVASFPDDAETKEDLIMLADKAMYIAKFSGKNQTCTN